MGRAFPARSASARADIAAHRQEQFMQL